MIEGPLFVDSGGWVTSSRLVEIAEIDARRRERAWELFTCYGDKVLSFTDCTSFALLQKRGLTEVFTFDSDFATVGFVERPGPGR